jgi:hypothetical protein
MVRGEIPRAAQPRRRCLRASNIAAIQNRRGIIFVVSMTHEENLT